MDTVEKSVRSRMMAAVPQKDTRPEMIVRRLAHGMGFRYRLHVRDLPGTPDIVFPRLRKIILVHGCYWHRHGCKRTTTPKSNRAFWTHKFDANQARDRKNSRTLRRMGWRVLVVWECWTYRTSWLTDKLVSFLTA